MRMDRVNNNYGSQVNLRVRASSTNQIDSYLMAEVTGAGTATNAVLKVYSNDVNLGVDVYEAASNSWTKSTITWNNKPGTRGGRSNSATPSNAKERRPEG